MSSGLLEKLVSAPDDHAIVIWLDENNQPRCTSFRCDKENNITYHLTKIIGGLLGLSFRNDPATFEQHFPGCLICPRFILPMINAGIKRPSQILDIWSKDILQCQSINPEKYFSNN